MGDRTVAIVGAIFLFLIVLLCTSIGYITLGPQLSGLLNQGKVGAPFPTPGATGMPGTLTPRTPGRAQASTGVVTGTRTPANPTFSIADVTPTPGSAGAQVPQTHDEIVQALNNAANQIKTIGSYSLNYQLTRSTGTTIDQSKSMTLTYLSTNNAERWIFGPPNMSWRRDIIHIDNQVWLGDATGYTPPVAESDIRNQNVYTIYRATELWNLYQSQLVNNTNKFEALEPVAGRPAYRYSTTPSSPQVFGGNFWLDAETKVPLQMDLTAQGDQISHLYWLLKPEQVTITPPATR